MTAALVVPKDWSEIDANWMTAALAERHPDAVVDAVTVDMRDDGTNRRARLAVTYSAGSGPATVFVKAVDPEHKAMVKLTSGLLHEPRLFNSKSICRLSIRSSTPPTNCPLRTRSGCATGHRSRMDSRCGWSPRAREPGSAATSHSPWHSAIRRPTRI